MAISTSYEKSNRGALGDLVDRSGAAELLGVSARTLDRWHFLREGPPRIQLGRKIRYRRAAIDNWVLARETVGPRSK